MKTMSKRKSYDFWEEEMVHTADIDSKAAAEMMERYSRIFPFTHFHITEHQSYHPKH